jgi:hypothetical protein
VSQFESRSVLKGDRKTDAVTKETTFAAETRFCVPARTDVTDYWISIKTKQRALISAYSFRVWTCGRSSFVDRCLQGSLFHHDQSRRSASSIQGVAQVWQARLLSSAPELGLPNVLQHSLVSRVHRGSKQSGRSDSSSYAVRPMRSNILHGTRDYNPSVSISLPVRLPWVVLSQLRRRRSRC